MRIHRNGDRGAGQRRLVGLDAEVARSSSGSRTGPLRLGQLPVDGTPNVMGTGDAA